jgi:glycosyltransferase involved in cell wall biosynthesis
MTKVSVVIPAFNEEKRIAQRLASITDCFSSAYGGDYEIIVVTDGCTDETPRIVTQCAREANNLVLLRYPLRLGKGRAIIEGFARAGGEVVVITDADDSVPPKYLLKLEEAAKTCGLAIGSRYGKDSHLAVRQPFLRYLLGRGFYVLARLMFWKLKRLSDTQCGAKAMRRHVAARLGKDLFITGFAFDVNLILATIRARSKIAEVGVEWRHCEFDSKVSKSLVKLVAAMLFALIRLRIYYSSARPFLETKTMRAAESLAWKYLQA